MERDKPLCCNVFRHLGLVVCSGSLLHARNIMMIAITPKTITLILFLVWRERAGALEEDMKNSRGQQELE